MKSLELGEGDDLVHQRADLRPLEAVDRAVQVDVVAPGEVGMEAGAELEQGGDAAAGLDAPRGRLDDPGGEAEERRLAGAVPADQADRLAGLDPHRDVAERPDLGRLGAVPGEERLLQRPNGLGSDEEAPARPVDDDLAGSHTFERTASARRTIPTRTATKAGSSFGISARSSRRPSSLGLLPRLGVEVPADLEVVGDEADRRDENVGRALRVERLEVVEDVGAEPGLAGRGLGLEAEAPVAQACGLSDELSRFPGAAPGRDHPRRGSARGGCAR